ncbi:hypothetical protein [Bradyrhizobium japonicum]|uniref:hypothetical protein n=1 Tax=Bradyrhizobium japonicum TaxID=375 RepID=UPI001B89EF81|nr:hypothetical protein [Bradyrhizobium japonicum]MBR0974034.1 hypothetical protein [Bradyrhizobium japonicum]
MVCPESINCDGQIYLWMRDTSYQPKVGIAVFVALSFFGNTGSAAGLRVVQPFGGMARSVHADAGT